MFCCENVQKLQQKLIYRKRCKVFEKRRRIWNGAKEKCRARKTLKNVKISVDTAEKESPAVSKKEIIYRTRLVIPIMTPWPPRCMQHPPGLSYPNVFNNLNQLINVAMRQPPKCKWISNVELKAMMCK